ncbi:MAG: prolyl oligopeptidase family serine peptidase [Micropruina sp.]|nr:prolyl oligopeptidase family serine peptidase [Micropruina sp.]
MKKLRILVLALAAALLLLSFSVLSIPAIRAEAHTFTPSDTASFTLNAKVLDSGQQIVSLTIDPGRLRIKPSSLNVDTFTVHAKGSNPFPDTLEPDQFFSEFSLDRTVTGVHLDRRGRIVVELASGYGVAGASTLAWANDVHRNIVLDLEYTVTQTSPITLLNSHRVTFSSLTQGPTLDPEVDAYANGQAAGLNYRLFTPNGTGKRPLIVWLHGLGEGGWPGAQDTDLSLLANRGARGFSTAKAQAIFGGAYVLAPQATDFWLNDREMGYSAKLTAHIDAVVDGNHIDKSRIYLVGASNGGYMTARITADNPGFFAAQVPICPVLNFGPWTTITDAELATVRTPTWVVAATTDDTVPFEANAQHLAQTVPGALLSAYPDVTWDGVTYPTHWSWIYAGRNDPITDKGLRLWQWMAKQTLKHQ